MEKKRNGTFSFSLAESIYSGYVKGQRLDFKLLIGGEIGGILHSAGNGAICDEICFERRATRRTQFEEGLFR